MNIIIINKGSSSCWLIIIDAKILLKCFDAAIIIAIILSDIAIVHVI